ncbi:MAG: DUF29 domain-containing protein [Thiohalocapsa sp.]|jgi:hypothetical protein|uniref:DUF29 domain-containing protein n=1 Tax=Thiohalocapsa sp. TaxID=2497641 RepID=UPI0025CEDCEB|nr:DUF29 domain-containing protein [Thiohalocapsa sp.]MCG6942026.1 DUF29 domain-containing protein [Thiohalocapsa sp.]
MHANADPYAADYDAWINAQAVLLRTGRLQELDAEQLAEELEAMSRRERNELVSRLIILIAHLLKWQYQPAHRSSSWRGSIVEQRVQIDRELRLSPSLKPFLPEAVSQAYPDALRIATQETGLDPSTFPADCPYRADDLLEDGFWPD